MEAQLHELTAAYNQLQDSSAQQLQQLEQQLAKEEQRKVAVLKGAGLRGRPVFKTFETNDTFLGCFEKRQNLNKCFEHACKLICESAGVCVCVVQHVVFTECAFKKTSSLI